MKIYLKKAGAYLACLMLILTLLPSAAFARNAIDLERNDCSLSITYPRPNIAFRLYYAAEVSKYGEFKAADDFAKYKVSFNGLDASGWKSLAATLDGYVKRDKLQPVETKSTDKNGQLTFSGKKVGLYLVSWDKHTAGGYTYTPQPFLISLPETDVNDNWMYNVSAEPKYDKKRTTHDGPGNPDTVNRRVMKIWKDDGNKADRPKSVTVQLLRNGIVYKEVTLNAKNNWRYEWKGLNSDDTWQMVEKDVPEGYLVSVGREGITFTVTNTKEKPEEPTGPNEDPTTPKDNPKDDPTNPPDDPPHKPKDDPTNPPDNPPDKPRDEPTSPNDEPDDPTDTQDDPDSTDVPSEPGSQEEPSNPVVPDGPGIPQTGQLWWPVSVLACGGMALFLAGWVRRHNSEHGETDE